MKFILCAVLLQLQIIIGKADLTGLSFTRATTNSLTWRVSGTLDKDVIYVMEISNIKGEIVKKIAIKSADNELVARQLKMNTDYVANIHRKPKIGKRVMFIRGQRVHTLLRCIVCTNAAKNSECKDVHECDRGERYCETNVQYVTGSHPPFKINKRCKKMTTCSNNYIRRTQLKNIFKSAGEMGIEDFLRAMPGLRYFPNAALLFRQNPQLRQSAIEKSLKDQALQYEKLLHKRCTGSSFQDDFCRCCCRTDRCNHGFMDCSNPQQPPDLPANFKPAEPTSIIPGTKKEKVTKCSFGNGDCAHTCSVVEDQVVCSCLQKYVLMEDKKSCQPLRYGARANAGPDIVVILPRKEVVISGSETSGDAKTFLWWTPDIKNTGLTISDLNAMDITVSNLRPGKYEFMLTVTGRDKKRTTDNMLLTVQESPLKRTPTHSAKSVGIPSPVHDENTNTPKGPVQKSYSAGQMKFKSLEQRQKWVQWNSKTSSTPIPTTLTSPLIKRSFKVVEVKLGQNGRQYITPESTKTPTTTKAPTTATQSTTTTTKPRTTLTTTKKSTTTTTPKPTTTTTTKKTTTTTTATTTTKDPYEKCDAMETETLQGSIECTGRNHGSKCSVACDVGKILAGGEEEIQCDNGTWSGKLACCDAPCPPFGVMDLVIVLDSMPNAPNDDYNILLSYIIDLVTKYKVGKYHVRLGLVTVGGNLVNTKIELGRRLETSKLRQIIMQVVKNRTPGRVLGQALKYLNVHSFRQLTNRPKVQDMAMVFTDGKSTDDVVQISRKLADLNIKIKVIGIVNDNEPENSQLVKEELLHIASEPSDLIVLENGFVDIASGALDNAFHSDFCPAPCSKYMSNNAICSDGSCVCKRGFAKKSAMAFMCTDTDECAANTAVCQDHSTCSNTLGSYECICDQGWEGDGKDECIDVNECLSKPCMATRETCVNTPGSYQCVCSEGFTLRNGRCVDVNECSSGTHDCPANALCRNNLGSFSCQCRDGYQGTGYYCKDVNECWLGLHNCHEQATCINEEGSFKCECKDGFRGSGKVCEDINECLKFDACPDDSYCINALGSFRCRCNAGYYGRPGQCKDVDECVKSPCDHQCENIPAAFQCSCNDGYKLNSDNLTCSDLNECATNNGGCLASCINEVGTHRCEDNCYRGYTKTDDGVSCTDLDECKTGQHDCHDNATCENAYGSFFCKCNPGYSGDGKNCQDVNECQSTSVLCEHGCVNTDGSYHCKCEVGLTYNTEKQTCVDINECRTGDFDCPPRQECINARGSYECVCIEGFFMNEDGDCTDVNECKFEDTCGINQKCKNLPGSFYCICDTGYEMVNGSCVDLDECSAGFDNCEPIRTRCINTIGSFKCNCRKGYTGDGATCTDINECKQKEDVCGENTICNNTIGSHICMCLDGFEESEDDCKDINECAVDNAGCQSICVNTPGSYHCACEEGFQLWEDQKACKPGCYSVSELEKRRINAKCSDESYLGSECKFTCDQGLLLKNGLPEATCTSKHAPDALPRWTTFNSSSAPCCEQRCPPNAFVDVIFVLDSSHTVQAENWATMVDFVISMMTRYKIHTSSMCFGAFRFNEDVDSKSEIKLSCNRNKGTTRRLLFRMPYKGRGSNPSRAITHLVKSSFASTWNRPNAPDVAILLTDGSSNNNITQEMNLLKKSGIQMHVIGIQNPIAASNSSQWMELAQNNEDNLTVLNGGFEGLVESLEEKLFGVLCSKPCARYSGDKVIPEEIFSKIEIKLKRRKSKSS